MRSTMSWMLSPWRCATACAVERPPLVPCWRRRRGGGASVRCGQRGRFILAVFRFALFRLGVTGMRRGDLSVDTPTDAVHVPQPRPLLPLHVEVGIDRLEQVVDVPADRWLRNACLGQSM